jgi:hypothetical protein
MLKLTYTSTGVTLERSVEPLEVAVRRRMMLGLRMGQPLGMEPTSVSLMVNRSIPGLKALISAVASAPASTLRLVQKEAAPAEIQQVEIQQVEMQQVEMQLQGYWLAQQEPLGEGIFMMNLDPTLEGHLVNIWQASQQDASCCS